MHDRAQFWSPVPDWSQASLRRPDIDVAPVGTASASLVSGNSDLFPARLGVDEILGPRQLARSNRYALRLAPDRVLFVSEAPLPTTFADGEHDIAVTDISDGMLIFDIRGEAAADLMAQGSEYPFEDKTVFPLESASMQFAGLRLIVSRRAQGWRLHIERPWAAALWRWLDAHVERAKL